MERQPRFETESVARAEPAGQSTPPRRRREQGIPQLAGRRGLDQQFEPVLPGVSRPADDHRESCNEPFG